MLGPATSARAIVLGAGGFGGGKEVGVVGNGVVVVEAGIEVVRA